MYSVAWPISGLFMLCLAAVLGEMASTWPVSGESASDLRHLPEIMRWSEVARRTVCPRRSAPRSHDARGPSAAKL